MEIRGNRIVKALVWTGIFLPAALGLSHCRLDDKGPHAEIFPKNGSKDVPVNTVIEVQFPAELNISDDQMKKNLFSIDECENDPFGYLNPKKETPAEADPKTDETNKTKKKKPKKTETTSTEETQNDATSSNSTTKYKANIEFFYEHHADDNKKTIFNYLVIDPDGRSTPLKPSTTYCVRVKSIKNSKGEKIQEREISFQTEESGNFEFDPKIEIEFFGNRLAPSQPENKENNFNRDYILINLRNMSASPSQIKSNITVCQATESNQPATGACKEFGKKVSSDVFLLEGLKPNDDQHILANYNLFAVSPRLKLEPGQKYKIVVNRNTAKDEEASIGEDEHEFEIDAETSLNWKQVYKNEVKDGDGNSVYSPNSKPLYIGSGS